MSQRVVAVGSGSRESTAIPIGEACGRWRWTWLLPFILTAGLLDFGANWLAAHYLIPVGPWIVPAGTFTFAFAFTVYDVIRRQGGLGPTVVAVLLGFTASVLYSLVFGGGVGRIAVAGLVALGCSSTADLIMQTFTLRRPIWQYVSISNLVSLAIDTVVFATLAFAMLPIEVRIRIMEGQYLAKVAMTVVSIPLVYWVRSLVPPGSHRA